MLSGTDLPLPGKQAGKYVMVPAANGKRLLITTDRLSAFDASWLPFPTRAGAQPALRLWFTHTLISFRTMHSNCPIQTRSWPGKWRLFPSRLCARFITGVTTTALASLSLGEREIYGYRSQTGCVRTSSCRANHHSNTKGGPTSHDERLTCAEVVERGHLNAQTGI